MYERHLNAYLSNEKDSAICDFVVVNVRTILRHHIKHLVSGCFLIVFVFI